MTNERLIAYRRIQRLMALKRIAQGRQDWVAAYNLNNRIAAESRALEEG